jgi:hypothetical protein
MIEPKSITYRVAAPGIGVIGWQAFLVPWVSISPKRLMQRSPP